MKFWERSRRKKSKHLLKKESEQHKMNLKPEDMYVTTTEELCLRNIRNHYRNCFGKEELDFVVAEIDLYQNGKLDKKQVHKFLLKTCSKVELTDMADLIDAPLTDWDPIVDPLVFNELEAVQMRSRNTKYGHGFFAQLRHRMKPPTS